MSRLYINQVIMSYQLQNGGLPYIIGNCGKFVLDNESRSCLLFDVWMIPRFIDIFRININIFFLIELCFSCLEHLAFYSVSNFRAYNAFILYRISQTYSKIKPSRIFFRLHCTFPWLTCIYQIKSYRPAINTSHKYYSIA